LKERKSGAEREEQFRRGVNQFNAEKFFHAHENWEVIWLKAAEPDKTFLQGITQVTAAFHHHAQGNREGAESLLQKGLRKLEQFPADYRGVRLEKLREELRKWAAALGKVREMPRMKKPKIGWVRKI
jgi:predicted metal-dependent hydrolase